MSRFAADHHDAVSVDAQANPAGSFQTLFETFLRLVQEECGRPLPDFVEKEFREYLKCGILAHGFLRAKCESCNNEHLVAFSCKRRGFCPSCGGRRMSESAIHLVDEVLPIKPIRQWVISFPIQIRLLLAVRPKIMSEVLGVVTNTISGHIWKKGGVQKIPGQDRRRHANPALWWFHQSQHPLSPALPRWRL